MSIGFFCARRCTPLILILGVILSGFQPHSSFAQNRAWSPIPIDSNWVNPENWIPEGVPTQQEHALITFPGFYEVVLSESQTVKSLTVGTTAGLQTLRLESGAVLTIEATGSVQGTGELVLQQGQIIGSMQNHATIRLLGGTLSALVENHGVVEASDSANSLRNALSNMPDGRIQVRSETMPAILSFGDSLFPRTYFNEGQFDISSFNGHQAEARLLGGRLDNQHSGSITLSGESGAAVLDVATVMSRGFFGGQGVVTGSLSNHGQLRVGTSPGTLEIGGSYDQSVDATLAIAIADDTGQAQHSLLDVAAGANLAGQLIIDVLDGFQPSDAEEFAIIQRAGGMGEFDRLQVSGIPQYGFQVRYETDAVIMRFFQNGVLSGDFNKSGQVEQGDLDLVLLNWGSQGRTPLGWLNDLPDGSIDQNELDRVLLNWGASAGLLQSDAAGIPEPASLIICMLALGAYAVYRRTS